MAGKKRMTIIICIIALIVVINLIIALLPGAISGNVKRADASLTEGTVNTVTANDRAVMENDRYVLTLDEESLGIVLIDKITGMSFESTKGYEDGNDMWNAFCNSGITVEFYSGASTVTSMVSITREKPSLTVEYKKDGFDADIAYEKYGFSMQLQVRLSDDGFSVYVPGASITEGDEYKVGAIWLYPMFGATYLGEKEGYMVIPEGVGATIDLSDNNGKYKNAYSKRIYGGNVGTDTAKINSYGKPVVTEPEKVTMPVFGMVYTEDNAGFLGIVTDGEYNAALTAYPNGVTTPYNWVTAKFLVRDVYTKQTAKTSGVPTFEAAGDIRSIGIRYITVAEDKADYTGLANTYQDYLVKKGILIKKDDSFEVRLNFLGADSKKWFLFNTLVPMTTVDQMDGIISDLCEEGVTDIRPVYTGWQKDGATLNYGSDKVSLESGLGSEEELRKLHDKLADKGIELTLSQELLKANTSRLYNTGSDIVKGINQVIIQVPTYQKLYGSMYYQTPAKASKLLDRFSSRYSEFGSVDLSGLSDTLFSYYSGGKTYTRVDTAAQYTGILDELEVNSLGMSAPNDYLWSYLDRYCDMSMTTSNYNFISEEIPFLPIVLRGYIPYWSSDVNFAANSTNFFLKLLEYGAYPSFLVTGESPVELRNTNSSYIYTSEYDVLKDRIIEYAGRIGEVLAKVEGVGIEEHSYILTDVVKVTYKNGAEVYINYSDSDISFDGITVPALSYAFKEGQE